MIDRVTSRIETGRAARPAGFAPSGRVARSACAALLGGLVFLTACASTPDFFVPDPGVDYSRGMFHVVERGDCLSSIAQYYRRSPSVVARLNRLRPPYTIRVGELLYIPPDNSLRIVTQGPLTLDLIAETREQMGLPHVAASRMKVSARPAVPDRSRSRDDGRPVRRIEPENRKVVEAGATRRTASKRKRRSPISMTPTRSRAPAFRWPLEKGSYVRGFSTANLVEVHKGIDIAAPKGTLIRAAQDGEVLKAEEMFTYGNLVILYHGGGFSTLYAHADRLRVKAGDFVRRGDVIATVGSTGRSTGPHLHLELRYNGLAYDPADYFPTMPYARKGGGWLASRKD